MKEITVRDRTKNTLGDLNNMLFMMAEEIMDGDATNEEFRRTMEKAKALSSIGSTIVANASLIFKAAEIKNGNGNADVPRLITGNPCDKNYIGSDIEDD